MGWRIGRGFVVRDLPWTEAQLRKIPAFESENWAVIALHGVPNKVQVGDMGIDGRIYPVTAMPAKAGGTGLRPVPPEQATTAEGDRATRSRATQTQAELGFIDIWYPIQVKQKDKVGRPDTDSFEAVMTREERTKGFFIAFDYSEDAMEEIGRFFKHTGKVIVALTVQEILDEQIARKLA